MKIATTLIVGTEIGVKRFYIPGVVAEDICPECKAVARRDFGDWYLSYPEIGTPIDIYLACPECDHNWKAGKVVLNLSLEVL